MRTVNYQLEDLCFHSSPTIMPTEPVKLNISFDQQSHPTLTLHDLDPKSPIKDVKDKIFHHTGFVKDKMELDFDGKILDDTKTLQDYQIPDGSHVHFKGFDAMNQHMV